MIREQPRINSLSLWERAGGKVPSPCATGSGVPSAPSPVPGAGPKKSPGGAQSRASNRGAIYLDDRRRRYDIAPVVRVESSCKLIIVEFTNTPAGRTVKIKYQSKDVNEAPLKASKRRSPRSTSCPLRNGSSSSFYSPSRRRRAGRRAVTTYFLSASPASEVFSRPSARPAKRLRRSPASRVAVK